MKTYIASVRDKQTKKVMIIEREYNRKADFESDLRGNGYAVRFISTPEKFYEDCEKYYALWEMNKKIKKAIYASDKQQAEKLNMSVVEYRKWLKS